MGNLVISIRNGLRIYDTGQFPIPALLLGMKAVLLKHRLQMAMRLCFLALCLCACNRQLDLREAFDEVSQIDRFEIEDYESDRYGFPESLGDAIVCIHPNSSCREKIINVLSKLPQEWLAFEETTDRQIVRFYMASSSLSDNLMFVHIGQGSGDTMLILFLNADLVEAKRFISYLSKTLGEN